MQFLSNLLVVTVVNKRIFLCKYIQSIRGRQGTGAVVDYCNNPIIYYTSYPNKTVIASEAEDI